MKTLKIGHLIFLFSLVIDAVVNAQVTIPPDKDHIIKWRSNRTNISSREKWFSCPAKDHFVQRSAWINKRPAEKNQRDVNESTDFSDCKRAGDC